MTLHAGGDVMSNGVGIIALEDINRDVVGVERWYGRIIVTWMMVRKFVYVIYVCGSQTGKALTKKGFLGKSWRQWWD